MFVFMHGLAMCIYKFHSHGINVIVVCDTLIFPAPMMSKLKLTSFVQSSRYKGGYVMGVLPFLIAATIVRYIHSIHDSIVYILLKVAVLALVFCDLIYCLFSADHFRPVAPPMFPSGILQNPRSRQVGTAVENMLSTMQGEMEKCPVCFEYTKFEMHQCGHVMCKTCCHQIVEHQLRLKHEFVLCPYCRQRYELCFVRKSKPELDSERGVTDEANRITGPPLNTSSSIDLDTVPNIESNQIYIHLNDTVIEPEPAF